MTHSHSPISGVCLKCGKTTKHFWVGSDMYRCKRCGQIVTLGEIRVVERKKTADVVQKELLWEKHEEPNASGPKL
jgi:tRNA(Ile2) C34 agmatinyltransferase TiaS